MLFNRDKTATATPEPVQAQVPKLRDADLAALSYGERVGGDFYDFIRVSPYRVVFGLLDVAGRSGQNAAILSAVQVAFRAQAQNLLAEDNVNEADAMTQICLQLNRTVLQAAGGIHSCPAFAGCYNENLGIVCYFNAGHTPALVRDSNGIVELAATGLPLGLFSHATCEAPMTALPPAAALLLVSRGVIEGRSKGEEFGLGRVKETLQKAEMESAQHLCRTVIEDVRQFMHTPPTHNDVTALALIRSNVN
jgi:sigma-B regulation protein RsbU (phosphoserine phosphatase)